MVSSLGVSRIVISGGFVEGLGLEEFVSDDISVVDVGTLIVEIDVSPRLD